MLQKQIIFPSLVGSIIRGLLYLTQRESIKLVNVAEIQV